MPTEEKAALSEKENAGLLYNESFFEDEDFQYPEFDRSFDCEVIFPVNADELVLPILPEQSKAKKSFFESFDFAKSVSATLFFVEKTGEVTRKLFSFLLSKFGFLFVVPFLFLLSLFKKVAAKISRFFKNAPRDFSDELRSIKAELSAIKKGAKNQSGENGVFLFLRALSKYFVLSFSRHDRFWKTLFNTAFPIAACLAVILVFSGGKDSVLALDVTFNNTHLGYIEQEDTFEEAKTLALGMLPNGVGKNGISASLLKAEPSYTLKKVNVNELSNSGMVCEKLLSASGTSLERACGIYIDGEFLCAVKNESDASSVFNSIIEPVKKESESDSIVAFVEEIDYVQGLYPNDEKTLWDSAKLKNTLSKPKSTAEYYKTQKGDTAFLVAKNNNISVRRLKALNPGVDFSKKLGQNTKLLVKSQSDYLKIKVMKTKVTKKLISYEKITRESSSMLKGTKKISQNGSYGEKLITSLVTYINGEKTYSTVVSEKQTKEPVNEITLIGTKSPYSGYYSSSDSSYSYSSSGFIWPTRGAYSLSSGYGYRSASISGWGYHGGIDIVRSGGSSAGTPVIAAASGTVVTAYAGSTGYGNTVLIDHGNGYQTRYGHMLWGSITVYSGQHVYQGQQIGQIGSTGNSTGPHLHFEILKNGVKQNPLPYIA